MDKSWVNKPCPKCGDNLLTERDYNNYKTVMDSVDFVNSLTDEQMKAMQDMVNKDSEFNDLWKSIQKQSTSIITMDVDAHKDISINGVSMKKED